MKEDIIKNLFDNAKNKDIDDEFHTFFVKTLNNLPNRKRSYKKAMAAAMLIIVILSGTFINSDSTFANANIIKGISNFIGNNHKLVSKYTTSVNKSVINKGITVTIDELASDSNSIVIKYTVRGTGNLRKLSKDGQKLNIAFFLDLGSEYSASGMGYLPFTDGKSYNCFIYDNTYSALEAYSINQFDIKDKFKLGIKINQIGTKKGKWQFQFDVDKRLIKKDTKELKHEIEFKFKGGRYKIDRISISPLSSVVDVSIISGKPIMHFTIADDKGKRVSVGSIYTEMKDNNSTERLKFGGYDILPNKVVIIPQENGDSYDLNDGIPIDL